MSRAAALALAIACAAAPAAAQVTKAPIKSDTAKARVQGPATKAASPTATGTTAPRSPAGGTKAPVAPSNAPTTVATTPTIMREVFPYQQEGRRDPFATLLTSSDLRPTIADLRLTGILFDENGSNSIAVMRDIGTNALYRVTTGQTLGRMKVALIKRKAVIFSIESFGLNRQDSLVLGDTTKVRAK